MKKLCSGWDNSVLSGTYGTMLRDMLELDIACGSGCGARVGRGSSYSTTRHERIGWPSGFGCDLKEKLQYDSSKRGFLLRKCPTKYYGSVGSDKM